MVDIIIIHIKIIRMKTLNDVKLFLSEIPFIHYGGCGIAALVMIRWIRKKYNKDISYIYFDHRHIDNNIAENRNYIKNNIGKIYAPSHVYISYNGKIFDVDERAKRKNMRVVLRFKSEKILVDALNNIDSWNDKFDRNTAITKIEKILNISLSDVLKQ